MMGRNPTGRLLASLVFACRPVCVCWAVGGVSTACAFQAADVTPIPAGPAESVVLVATEFERQTIFTATGIVFTRDESNAYIAVDSAARIQFHEGVQKQFTYSALVGHGDSARRVVLEKAAVLESGKRTIFRGPAGDLPTPCPHQATAAVREGAALLLVGLEAIRSESGTELVKVAVPGVVEGLYRNPVTLVTSYGFKPSRPALVSRGLLVTPEGAVVATAVVDPEKRRTTSGYTRYLGRPLSEFANIGAPEVADARANIRVFGGKATIEVVLRPLDPLARLKRPRMLVRTSFAPGREERMSMFHGALHALRPEQAPITIEHGRWVDKTADAQEIDLAILGDVDPSLDLWVDKDKLPPGQAWGGRCEFHVQEQGPFAWLFVDVADDGSLTPIEPGAGVVVCDNIELFSNVLRPFKWGDPYPTQARKPTLARDDDGRVVLCDGVARDIPMKPVEYVPKGVPQRAAKPLLGEVQTGPNAPAAAVLDLPVERKGHYYPYDLHEPMCLSADGKSLFVVDGAYILHKIDVTTWTDVLQLPLADKCEEIAPSSAGLIVYLTDQSVMLVVDFDSFAVKHVLAFAPLHAFAACAKSPYVYVSESNRWLVFDAVTGRSVKSIPQQILQASGMPLSGQRRINATVTPDGRHLFAGAECVARIRLNGLQMVLEEVSPELSTDNSLRIATSADGSQVALPTNTGRPRGAVGFEIRNGRKLADDPQFFDNGAPTRAVGLAEEAGFVFSHGAPGTAAVFDLQGRPKPTAQWKDNLDVRHILVLPPGDRAVYWGGVLTVVDLNVERLKAAKK